MGLYCSNNQNYSLLFVVHCSLVEPFTCSTCCPMIFCLVISLLCSTFYFPLIAITFLYCVFLMCFNGKSWTVNGKVNSKLKLGSITWHSIYQLGFSFQLFILMFTNLAMHLLTAGVKWWVSYVDFPVVVICAWYSERLCSNSSKEITFCM